MVLRGGVGRVVAVIRREGEVGGGGSTKRRPSQARYWGRSGNRKGYQVLKVRCRFRSLQSGIPRT